MKVVFCVPTLIRPYQQCLDSLEASLPLLDAAGIDHAMVNEIGNPYISAARATMLRKALDAKADVVVFIDHDLSWRPQDMMTLIQTEGDVVGGTYRVKTDDVCYMGTIHSNHEGTPIVRNDGAIKARLLPAGFLKVTPAAVHRFMDAYPELCYGERYRPSVDLFNHGAHKGLWWGEDYAFCRRWEEMGEDAWLIPNVNLTHHGADGKDYPGNFHIYLRQQPGGDLHADAAAMKGEQS
jgi:glycosyltransferase involved in cell wall biosynthesis